MTKPPQLSKRALAMLNRLYEGRFYKDDATGKPSKTMQELKDAGLVYRGARVMVFGSYYVPHGHTSFALDEMPPKPAWLVEALKEQA